MKFPFRRKKNLSPPAGRQRVSQTVQRAPLYSYYASRSLLQDTAGRQRFRPVIDSVQTKRAVNFTIKRIGAVTASIALLVSAVSVLTLSSNARILRADPDQQTFSHPVADYRQSAREILNSSLLNRTKLTINTAAVGSEMVQRYPDLQSAVVKLPLIDRSPIVYLLPAKPIAKYQSPDGKKFLIDTNGRIIANGDGSYARSFIGELPVLRDNVMANTAMGSQVLPNSTISAVEEAQYQLKRAGLSVSEYVLPAGKSELDIYFDGLPYFAKLNLASASTLQQVGTFLAVRHYLAGRGALNIQYIDVRVDGRAYYK